MQFLNRRYTKYELRILALLADKAAVVASGEIETMALIKDGLIVNAKTLETQSILITNNSSGERVFEDVFVQSFAARLTEKRREFIDTSKSSTKNLLDIL